MQGASMVMWLITPSLTNQNIYEDVLAASFSVFTCSRKKTTESFGTGTLDKKESSKEAEAFSWSEVAAKVRKCLVYTRVQFGAALK